jgi:hypothetical protein
MRKGIGNRINEKIMQKYINIHGASGRYFVGVWTALHGHTFGRETMPVQTVSVMREADASFHAHPDGL